MDTHADGTLHYLVSPHSIGPLRLHDR
jgi:hypothetical protein